MDRTLQVFAHLSDYPESLPYKRHLSYGFRQLDGRLVPVEVGHVESVSLSVAEQDRGQCRRCGLVGLHERHVAGLLSIVRENEGGKEKTEIR